MTEAAQELINKIVATGCDLSECRRVLEAAAHESSLCQIKFDDRWLKYRERMVERYGEERVAQLEKEARNEKH